MALSMGRTVKGVEWQFPNLQEEHALPMQLDLPEGQTQSEVATRETMVGDRQMAVFVKERELSTTHEACKVAHTDP